MVMIIGVGFFLLSYLPKLLSVSLSTPLRRDLGMESVILTVRETPFTFFHYLAIHCAIYLRRLVRLSPSALCEGATAHRSRPGIHRSARDEIDFIIQETTSTGVGGARGSGAGDYSSMNLNMREKLCATSKPRIPKHS